jgi:micrococcal nuclease
MREIFLLSVVSLLVGCANGDNTQSLQDYFKSINYVQEQNISAEVDSRFQANLSSLEWAAAAFANRCEWYGLERVVDGDTIIVQGERDRVRVRMIGIDTPESKKAGTPIEAYALQASSYLKALLQDELEVCLVEDAVGDKYDTYDRKLSYVFTSEGKDINATMIQGGLAEAYTRYPMERKEEFMGYEQAAREAKIGQWAKQ